MKSRQQLAARRVALPRPALVPVPLAPVVAPVASGRCCERAVERRCVCVKSTECPAHGVRCVGSHD